mgnify:FL=1
MEMKKVLKYAMEIGECMLVSGAGVSRVEDTISRICKAYGAKEANVFSITSSIVTTIEDEKGEILTQTKRIRSYKTDFTKLDELNQLSRYMCKELPEEEEVKRKISEIKKGKVVVFTEEVLTSAVIAAAWTSFYGGGITEGIIAMIAGAFVAVLARYIKILAPNEMVLNFLLSFFVAAFAYISAKFGLTEDYGNPSSLHNKGVIAENYMNDARKKIAKTLKVQEKEICFTSGGTESNNLAIIGVAEANKRSGKHVITTSIEHPSVSATMAYLEEHGYDYDEMVWSMINGAQKTGGDDGTQ